VRIADVEGESRVPREGVVRERREIEGRNWSGGVGGEQKLGMRGGEEMVMGGSRNVAEKQDEDG